MEWIRIFSGLAEAQQRLSTKPQLVIIGEKRICLVRHENTFRAVQDACTHNGESLSKGQVNFRGEIICPWHNYCFDLSSGREMSGRSADLETFPIRIDDKGFFIGI